MLTVTVVPGTREVVSMWTFDGAALRSAVRPVAALASLERPFLRSRFGDGCVELVGDDTATQALIRVPAIVEGSPFRCGIPAAIIGRVLGRVSGGPVDVERFGDRVRVAQDGYEAHLRVVDDTRLPPRRLVGTPVLGGSVKRDRVCAAFDAVLPAVAVDDTSPLHGVRLERSRGDSWVVATDRYRMHAVMLTGRLGFTEPVTVPPVALRLVRSAVVSPLVSIGTVDDTLYVSGDSGEVATRGVVGPWVRDWVSILRPPVDVETSVTFDGPELLAAVRAVEESLQARTVTLELSPDTNRVSVSATTEDGTATASCPAEVRNGVSVLDFHASLLIDALKPLGPAAKMTVPIAVQPTHFASANDTFQALVSPNTP